MAANSKPSLVFSVVSPRPKLAFETEAIQICWDWRPQKVRHNSQQDDIILQGPSEVALVCWSAKAIFCGSNMTDHLAHHEISFSWPRITPMAQMALQGVHSMRIQIRCMYVCMYVCTSRFVIVHPRLHTALRVIAPAASCASPFQTRAAQY